MVEELPKALVRPLVVFRWLTVIDDEHADTWIFGRFNRRADRK
jgi:hypothetical protein